MSLLEHIMQNIISYNTVNNITEVINKNFYKTNFIYIYEVNFFFINNN